MPSVWMTRRQGKTGVRHRVLYRIGGHENSPTSAGSFKTKREARLPRDWIAGDLAAMRVLDLRLLTDKPTLPTLAEAAERWRASRIDVEGQTQKMHPRRSCASSKSRRSSGHVVSTRSPSKTFRAWSPR